MQWDGTKYVGYANFSDGKDEMHDETLRTTQVFIFMLNYINERWKLPVGYFFINTVGGTKSKMLSFPQQSRAKVISLTFDGAGNNKIMCKELGALLKDSKNLKPWFHHPCTGECVYILYDPPHALKLIRNTLDHFKVMYDEDNNAVR